MKTQVTVQRLLIVAALLLANVSPAWSVRVYCHMAESETHIYEDARVRLMLLLSAEGDAQLIMENKTDRPLYVNRANSFGYVGAESFTLYVPSSRTESRSEVYGSIDLDPRFPTGEVRGYGHSSSYTEHDRAVLPLAPHGQTVVYVFTGLAECMDPGIVDIGRRGNARHFGHRGHFVDPQTGATTKFRRGQVCRYSESASPLLLSALVEYSFSRPSASGHDAQEQAFQARVSDYVSEVSVGRSTPSARAFSFRSGGGNGLLCVEIATGAIAAGVLIDAASIIAGR